MENFEKNKIENSRRRQSAVIIKIINKRMIFEKNLILKWYM
jgi:hypothetical protein